MEPRRVEGDANRPAGMDFMNGDCHVFAVALHRAYGFRLLLLRDQDVVYGDGVAAVVHVMAVDCGDNAYDLTGRRPLAEVVGSWLCAEDADRSSPDTEMLEDEESLREYVSDDWSRPLSDYSDSDVERALAVAERVLGERLPPIGPQPRR